MSIIPSFVFFLILEGSNNVLREDKSRFGGEGAPLRGNPEIDVDQK